MRHESLFRGIEKGNAVCVDQPLGSAVLLPLAMNASNKNVDTLFQGIEHMNP